METRSVTARKLRKLAADLAHDRHHEQQLTNGEEAAYPGYVMSYSKGLPHNELGEVNPDSYRTLLRAMQTQDPADFDKIVLGGARKLTNPQAGLAYDLEGPDGQSLALPPPPTVNGEELASEMMELYWMALLRDVSFVQWNDDHDVKSAADELSAVAAYRGPRDGERAVTPQMLFRGDTAGDQVGPYVSQFLWMGTSGLGGAHRKQDGQIQYGSVSIDQRQRTVAANVDWLTSPEEWLSIQNGVPPKGGDRFDDTKRFIRNMRDMANYVHFDALYQSYVNACLILLGTGAPVDQGNPYRHSKVQAGFGSFGEPHVLTLVAEVATRALKAVWYQKWFVHRRLRPEEFGGRLHQHLTGNRDYPTIHPAVLNSKGLERIHNATGSYLLPQAYPEGSPTHPAYGAGHATVAGACATILKAWFDDGASIEDPVQANGDGTELVAYDGDDRDQLTIGGELDKLAANMSIGRNMGGVHWRTDYTESVRLGERIALGVLEEQRLLYNEPFQLSLTTFDGDRIGA